MSFSLELLQQRHDLLLLTFSIGLFMTKFFAFDVRRVKQQAAAKQKQNRWNLIRLYSWLALTFLGMMIARVA